MLAKTASNGGVAGYAGKSTVSAVQESNTSVTIKKLDEEQQLVFGEVYAPGFPDSQGDFMSVETIQNMAHEFLRKGRVANIDLNHNQELSGCYVVESFIARDDDKTFIPGSWVLGVKIPDPEIWNLVKSGELNGFSLDGAAVQVPTVLEIEMPQVLTGKTEENDGHSHTFEVRFDNEGNFLGGTTSPGPDGHVHKIARGTITEKSSGHDHRFSFVEGILNVQASN
ncbi:XkdF-like putative serine protease domain-containing protein [Hyphomicrobium sp.]|uniref:XkdF-like putative serine protease domain-containing protein n=1 Tax=Hyphomicrobium sp. TaxID=82 RepID=UPI001DED7D64|nr:XkdF-like putative serine protease domain-containing protein [Hyphomicrobium sp.]MBY0559998.1 hypothetical protein [Hyphomicrobium sp.]